MFDIDKGFLKIDNKNVTDLNLNNLRSQIGFVPQEVFLFSDSIKNNITFGVSDVTTQQIIEAAKNADVYNNIMDFELQFDLFSFEPIVLSK